MRKTTYIVKNNEYGYKGINTARAKAKITSTVIQELEKTQKGYDSVIENDFCNLLENIVAMLDNYKIRQYEIGDSREENEY